MFRKIIGLIVGYAIFLATLLALFILTGQDPHGHATINFKIVTLFYGIFISFLCGLVLQFIAKTNTLTLNYIFAGLLVAFAAVSLIDTNDETWSQLLSIFIFAPASILGGLFYIKRIKRKVN